jgi:uncharacterized membrane protein YgcG
MKRLISVLLAIVVIFSFGVSVSAYENTDKVMLFDGADFLSDAEEESLFEMMVKVSDAYDLNLEFITTAEDFTNDEIIAYAESNYDYDFGADSNGSLFLIDSANGNWVDHFVLAGEVDEKVSDDQLKAIITEVQEPIIDYDEHTAALRWLLWLDNIYGGVVANEIVNTPVEDYSGEWTVFDEIGFFFSDVGYTIETFFYNIFFPDHINLEIAFAFALMGLIGGIITFAIIWERYKKHAKVSAVHYLDKNTVNIYSRSDRFVREYTTRTVHSDSSSGGGGGRGGRSHGGGSHGGGGSRGRR